MKTIVGVLDPSGKKVYYFDPKDIEFAEGENVIVETTHGLEYGQIVIANKEVEDKEVKHELKPVVRKASPKDEQQVEKITALRKEAMRIATEKAEAHKLKLKFVECLYTFDMRKVLLYFTADGRVDFRELLKDLPSALHARIELIQIYERDDIKMRGALAPCGRPCCCNAFLNDFAKVTIKMAKVQGLSLSPTKISGMCGKLMCCLKYESEYYTEVSKEMPKLKSHVTTPDGEGVVSDLDMLRRQVVVKIVDGESVEFKRYPLEQIKGYEKRPVGDDTGDDGDDDTDEIPVDDDSDELPDGGEDN